MISRAGFVGGVAGVCLAGTTAIASAAAPWWAAAAQRSLWVRRLDGADRLPDGTPLHGGMVARFFADGAVDMVGYDALCYALRDAHPTAYGRGWVAMAPALLQLLWEIQQVVMSEGIRGPLVSHSGYRSIATNLEVGGVVNSEHLAGAAADIHVDGYPLVRLRDVARSAPGAGGVGYYPRGGRGSDAGWIHVDVGDRRQWEG